MNQRDSKKAILPVPNVYTYNCCQRGRAGNQPAMSCDYPIKGTPQGGILSNIVLNELDWWVASQWENMPTHYEYKTRQNFSCAIK